MCLCLCVKLYIQNENYLFLVTAAKQLKNEKAW